MSSPLAWLPSDANLVVFIGEGGVGKTSVAAATALAAAARGRRVAVLTVDPAPRLGDALGLSSIDGRPREVGLPEGCAPGGKLHAQRLDTKGTFDRMVESFSPSPSATEVLLANPIYQAVSTSLGGSEHYMTFQRLYELVTEGRYDTLVIDTPPAVHAADLLSTPVRLSALLETGAPAVLADPARILARSGSRLARSTAATLIAVIERVSGIALTAQISEFIASFESMLADLSDRTEKINTLLKDEKTAFCLVTRPQPRRVSSSLAFARALAEHSLHPRGLIVNRLTPAQAAAANLDAEEAAAQSEPAPAGTGRAARAMEAAIAALRQSEAKALRELEAGLQASGLAIPTQTVESLDRDVTGIGELVELAAALYG